MLGTDGQVISHLNDKLALKPSTEIAAGLTPDAVAAMARDGAAPVELALEGAQKLLKARRIPGTDWYLVVALDKTEATVGLTQVLHATLISLVVLTLVAVVLASVITSRAFKRLSAVRDAMATGRIATDIVSPIAFSLCK